MHVPWQARAVAWSFDTGQPHRSRALFPRPLHSFCCCFACAARQAPVGMQPCTMPPAHAFVRLHGFSLDLRLALQPRFVKEGIRRCTCGALHQGGRNARQCVGGGGPSCRGAGRSGVRTRDPVTLRRPGKPAPARTPVVTPGVHRPLLGQSLVAPRPRHDQPPAHHPTTGGLCPKPRFHIDCRRGTLPRLRAHHTQGAWLLGPVRRAGRGQGRDCGGSGRESRLGPWRAPAGRTRPLSLSLSPPHTAHKRARAWPGRQGPPPPLLRPRRAAGGPAPLRARASARGALRSSRRGRSDQGGCGLPLLPYTVGGDARRTAAGTRRTPAAPAMLFMMPAVAPHG